VQCVQDQPAKKGEIRYWVRDTVALSLVTTAASFPTVNIIALDTTISGLLKSAGITTVPKSETAVIIHQTAIAFARLQPTAGQDCVARAVDALNHAIAAQEGSVPLNGQPEVQLVSSAPDFYLVEQNMDHIGGSPGGPPSWTGSAGPNAKGSTSLGGGSTVYILDTVDPLSSPNNPGTRLPLASSLSSLCVNDTTGNCSRMVGELGAPGTVDGMYVPLADENISTPAYGASTSIREHGVFISAIIHHLAGGATVHLIRVLNDYGVGDLQSLATGLAMVQQNTSSPVFVNLSLDIVPPLGCLADVLQNPEGFQSSQNLNKCAENDSMPSSLTPIVHTLGRPIADVLSLGHVVVSAAAGNDSNTPPGARYNQDLPAAFCGVVAVAAAQNPVGAQWVYPASPNPQTLDPESNRSNGQCVSLPTVAGIAPPSQAAGDKAVALGDNICSLYLQSFSGGNPLGFAEWSGTSFATAYITGNLASDRIPLTGSTSPAPDTTAPLPALDESQPCTP
jgi:hypothetical protein